jgi:hypothetical protein
MDETTIYAAAFITLIAVAIGTVILAVKRDGRNVGDLIKQLVICIAIASLLPLTSFAGATMLHPKTKLNDLIAQQQRAQQETYDTKEVERREKSRDQAEALRKQIEDEQRAFYRAMFWVGFPIGFAAFVAGFFLRGVAVATGFAFGGLCTLTAGCYSYWNDMGDPMRFFSLLIVLITVTAIGLIKFGRPVAQ